MTTRIAAATGNWLTGATWQDADATSLLVSSANSTLLTTSYVASSTFTPGAITIDGIAVWVLSRAASPTGTVSIALDQAGSDVAGTPVTINVADIPVGGNCWVLFKFAAPVTLLAATLYSVKAKTSNASQVTLNRNATAGNWSRLLRTTTSATPGAADPIYILGEKTGAGTGNTITVTMDDAAAGATVYGQVDISAGGVLSYGVVASIAYYLKQAGDFIIRAGGIAKLADVGSAMPATSSGVLEFNCGSNVQYGLIVKSGGTLIGQGNPITVKAKLNADAAAAATSLTTDVSTGWKNGDEIGIPSTTRTFSQAEKKTMSGDATGTSVPIAALTNAHGGNSSTGVQADLINLTRNIKIRGISTSLQAYISIEDGAIVDLDYVEMHQLGGAGNPKDGLTIAVHTTGSDVNIQNCSLHDFVVAGSLVRIDPTTTLNCPIYFNHNVGYNIQALHIYVEDRALGTGSLNILDHVAIKSSDDNNAGVNIKMAEAIVNGLTVASCAAFFTTACLLNAGGGIVGTFKNITAYGNNATGVNINSAYADKNTDIGTLTCWRNSGGGLGFGSSGNICVGIHLTGTNTFFGNAGAGFQTEGHLIDCSIYGGVLNAGTTLTQAVGWEFCSSAGGIQLNLTRFYAYNCTFGASQTHATGDLQYFTGSGAKYVDVILVNCLLASSTEIDFISSLLHGSSIKFQRRDQTVNLHKKVTVDGVTTLDAAIFDTSPSIRMTPAHASIKTETIIRKKQVASGNSVTVDVKVRCSVVGDGAAYNGARPRLIQKAQPGAGTDADVVLDTATVASDGAWETLTGTIAAVSENCVIAFVVDCDGTAGWVNIDTLTVT